jgi:hypothetical protein
MRRLLLLAPVVLVGALALTGCSGAGPIGDAAGKSASATHGKPVDPVTVIDGMHYVQLFNAVDPVVTDLGTSTDGPPPSTELRDAAASLHQFATQARGLPSSGSAGQTVQRLAVASTTLARQLSTLAAKGEGSSTSGAGLTSALAEYRSAAAAARKAAGLRPLATPRSPHPDTGP